MPASLLTPSATSPSGHALADSAPGARSGHALNVLYVPSRMPAGVVVGLWGTAILRQDDGGAHPLKLGDVVLKGDVLLTQQNGIVEISLGTQIATNARPSVTGDPDLDRIVAQLDVGEIDISPGAGLSGSDGSLQPGLVVDRIIEVVTPQEYQFAWNQLGPAGLVEEAATPTAPLVVPEPADIDAQIRLDGPASVIEGRTAGGYTVTLTHPAGTDIEVSLTYRGSATNGADYVGVTTITIPAGQTTASFDIRTLDDAIAEGSEVYTVTLGDVAGGDFASLTIDPAHAAVTTTIVDDAGPGGPEAPGPEDTCFVSIAGPGSVIEGEVASGYTVRLSQPAASDVTVRLTYAGTATDGSDFTAVTEVVIPAGQSSATFDIRTIDDALAEGSESFTVSVGAITGGGFEAVTADPERSAVTTTITDDITPGGPGTPGGEDTCFVSIAGPGSVIEGEVASGYTVRLSQPAASDVTVRLTYAGTATDGSDFTAVTEVVIPAGQSSATFDIRTIDDALAEGSESFTVSLGAITGGGFEAIAADPARASITTTITDDVTPVGPGTPGGEDTCLVSIAGPGSVIEGEVASGYTVRLSQPAASDVTVKLTYAGTATDGSDFTAVTEVVIPAGQSSASFDIRTLDDALAEGSESFTVSVGAITGGGFEAVTADPERSAVTTTITDDVTPGGPGTPGSEDTCLVSIAGPGSVIEGEVASGYTVRLSQPAASDVTVRLTYAGTATDGSDFTAVTEVVIPAGQSSATFDIRTIDDALAEGSESFTVSLGAITGGGFEAVAADPERSAVTTTITDDVTPGGPVTPGSEDTCLVSIAGPGSVVEGEIASGYTVRLSQPAASDVTVKLTYAGTATDGSDFTAVTEVVIPAGQSSATFDIRTIDDALAEGSESFTVSLGAITGGGFEAVAADPARASITTTITDDVTPGGPGTPGSEDTCFVSIAGPGSVIEGEVASGYTVRLSQPAASDVTVKLTYAGTATDGSDFTAVTEVVIPAGQSSATFDIRTIDDALAEGSESFTVSVGAITGGGFEAVTADPERSAVTTTITDDITPGGPGTPGGEDTCFVSIAGPGSVIEGEVASGYTVRLSQPTASDVTVKLTYAGTATDGSDFTAVTEVVIPAGQSSATFDIRTIDDALAEGSESFTVSVGAITGGGFEAVTADPARASITTTITDDVTPGGPGTPGSEDTCFVSIAGPGSVVEGEIASGYTVRLSQPAASDVTVRLTYAGTATDGSDFTAVTEVVIPAGQSSATFDIRTIDDALAEGSESFTVSLGAITGGGFEAVTADPARASITTTITDDVTPGGPGTPGGEDTCFVSIAGPGSVIEGEVASGYTVRLSQPAASDVTVRLTYAGTATDGSDFTAVTEVVIPAGQSSASFDIRTLDDALAEGSESFTVSLGPITGGGFEAIAADPAQASITTTLVDDTCAPDAVQVSLSGPDSVVEGEVATGYTVTLTQPAASDMVVHLSYSGTAADGTDFTKIAVITIAAGQSSATFAIATLDDALAEGSEQFVVAIDGVDGGGFERLAVDADHASVRTTIVDDVGPGAPGGPVTPDDADRVLVALSGPDSVTEGDTATGYTVSLSQPAVTDVTVRLVYSGTATEGTDFVKVATVTIAAGQSSARFDLATLDDALAEGTETITVALGQISGGGFEEIAGDPARASVTTRLHDDSGPGAPGGGTPPDAADTVLVSLSGPGCIVEGETAGGYTVTLSQPAVTDVTIQLTYAGTATDGSDYTAVTEVVIAAGQSSATFDLRTIDDALAEGTETITVSIGAVSGGGFEALVANPVAQSVTTQLVDDVGPGGATPGAEDTCQVSLAGPGSVVEGEVASGYTVTLSQPALTDVVVRLNYAGSATDGSDYARVVSVTIPAGQSSARFDIATLADAASEGPEHFTISLGSLSGGGFEAIRGNPVAFSVTTEIVDVAVNRAPTPEGDSAHVAEDGVVRGNVLANDTDPDGDTLAVTQFTWNDQTHAAGTPLTLPGIGTLVVQGDGSYVFTPAPDYGGPVPAVSCTISDGRGGTAPSTLTLTIDPVNDAPRVGGGAVTLSEEGLPGGHPDSATETRVTSVTGSLQFSDADGDRLSFTLSAPSGLYASGGQALVWHGDGSAANPLVGSAGGQAVLSATIDDQGRYQVTLHAPLDHPVRHSEDTLTLSLGVQVSDGQATSTASLDVTVRDDSPTPFCVARCADLSLVQTNLLITLDVSGSMSTCDGVGGQTRLQSAIASINKLIDSYADQGDVAVRLVTFSTSAAERGDHWMSIDEARAVLACLRAGGNTNYDAAIDTARGAFDDPGLLPGGQNVAYFFSDGRPNLPSCDVGIDAGEQKVWEEFLTAHDIQSYAIGLGGDVPVSALAPIAFNGLSGQDDIDPLVVTRFDQLDAVLSQTVAPALSGDLTDSGGLQGLAGADGGHLSDVIANGVHHPWDPATASEPTVTVQTATGGAFTIDMTTGHYSYQPPAGVQADYREVLTFTLTDRDGDSRNGTLTLNVNADGNSSFDVHCTASSSCLSSGDVLTWTLSDHCGGTTGSTGSGDGTAGGCGSLQSHDLLGGGGQDPLACWSSSSTGSGTAGGCGTGAGTSTPDPASSSGSGCTSLSSTEWQLAQTLIRQGSDSTCSP